MRRSTWEVDSNDGDKEKGSVAFTKAPVKQPETWGEMAKAWPKTTFCIVSNEFCERFSYYGMRTVLTLYLLNVLKFSDNMSTVFFNGFTVLCYLTPLLGSIIADGYIGKFKTIFTVSILYAAGQILLAFSSIKNSESPIHPWLDLAGLIIIGFGTGGIKPCVASFGGDQFEPGQERMLSIFFSVFYFSINAGSMISTFISPLLRSKSCLGQDSCYPMAFGIPAVLMIVATVIFMLGSFSYKKPPPSENVFGEIYSLVRKSMSNKYGHGQKKEKLLDNYLNDHNCESDPKCMKLKREKRNKNLCQKVQFIDDVRQLMRIIVMFLPVPIFWALYDQQGSVWLIQAIQMDCRLWGDTLLLPDQMQTLNAVLILAFIPIFQAIIYPICSKLFKLTPLRKMIAGGLIASGAFVISGFVQLSVNKTLAELPDSGMAYISVMNNCNCNVTVTTDKSGSQTYVVGAHASIVDDKYNNVHDTIKIKSGPVNMNFTYSCPGPVPATYPLKYSGSTDDTTVYNLVLTEIGAYMTDVDTDKPTDGTGEHSLSINLALNDTVYVGHLALCRFDKKNNDEQYPCDPTHPENFYYYEVNYDDGNDNDLNDLIPYQSNTPTGMYASVYDFKAIRPGTWKIFYMKNLAKSIGMKSLSKEQVTVQYTGLKFTTKQQGGVYATVLSGSMAAPTMDTNKIVSDNVVSILWQVPQIFTITVAEILFSITGYEFAYSQSAPSMKAVVQALWLLTTAIGDTIIVLIAIADPFSNGAVQAFVYAGSMLVVIGVFALLSIFYYEYHYYTGDEVDETGEYVDEDAVSLANAKDGFEIRNGTTNKGFDEISLDEHF